MIKLLVGLIAASGGRATILAAFRLVAAGDEDTKSGHGEQNRNELLHIETTPPKVRAPLRARGESPIGYTCPRFHELQVPDAPHYETTRPRIGKGTGYVFLEDSVKTELSNPHVR